MPNVGRGEAVPPDRLTLVRRRHRSPWPPTHIRADRYAMISTFNPVAALFVRERAIRATGRQAIASSTRGFLVLAREAPRATQRGGVRRGRVAMPRGGGRCGRRGDWSRLELLQVATVRLANHHEADGNRGRGDRGEAGQDADDPFQALCISAVNRATARSTATLTSSFVASSLVASPTISTVASAPFHATDAVSRRTA